MMKDEKKVKLTEEAKKVNKAEEAKPEKNGAKLTDEELKKVTGGSVNAPIGQYVVEGAVRDADNRVIAAKSLIDINHGTVNGNS